MNTRSYITIDGGDNDDYIENWGEYVTIDGGADNDIIDNRGSSVTIDGGDGKNTITNGFHDVSFENLSKWMIEGLDDFVDYILKATNNSANLNKGGKDAVITSGKDDDLIINLGSYDSISSGAGNDRIVTTDGENNIINGEDDNDQIIVHHDVGSLILGGAGNDEITVARFGISDYLDALKFVNQKVANYFIEKAKTRIKNLILAASSYNQYVVAADLCLEALGVGWDIGTGIMNIVNFVINSQKIVEDFTSGSRIVAGAGNDTVICDGLANRTYYYSLGDGNDTVKGFSNADFAKCLNDILGVNTPLSTLHIESGEISSVTINGKDIIFKIGTGSVTLVDSINKRFNLREADGTLTTRLYSTNDKDELYSYDYENNLVIHCRGGNDSVYNKAKNSSIDGGVGNDYISNSGDNVLISGGADSDEIYNHAHGSTISGGTGNDYISNIGDNVSISGGSGNDFISSELTSLHNVTIKGGTGNDDIWIRASNTLIEYADGDGNDNVVGFNGNDTLKISALSYTLEHKGFDVIVRVGNGSITLKGGRLHKVNIDGTPEKDLVEVEFYDMKLDGDKLSLLKLNPDEELNMKDAPNEIKIIDASKSQTSVKVIGNSSVNEFIGSSNSDVFYAEPTANVSSSNFIGSSFVGEENVGEEKISAVTINGGGGNDTIYGGERENFYVYTSGDGNDVIYNVGANDTLSISGGSYSQKISGDDLIIKVGNGSVTFKNSANQTLNIIGKEIFEPAWNLVSTTATYGDLITVTGVKSLDGIAFDGKKTVTLSTAALNEETVTITKGYTLKIDKSVPTSSKTVAATWTKDDDEFTYTAAGTPAYYKLSSNKLTYTAAKGGEQFTLTGIADTKGVKVSGKKVTVGKTALGDSDITLTTEDGFTLALDKSVTVAKEISAGWKKFTYTAAGTTEGYVLDGDKIVYSEQDGGETFTISGVKDIKNIFVDGKTVTVGKNSLNGKTVELTGDTFELALAGDVPTEATEKSGKFTSCAKGTAIFKTSSYSNDFYTLGDDKIFYTAAGGNEIKISGLNLNATLADVPSAIKISDDGGSLKISFNSADVLNNKAPTISAPKGVSYTVAVDEELSKPTKTLQWSPKGTNATLAADTSATYAVKSNKITCTPKKSGKPEVVLAGLVKDAKLATPKDKLITLDASNLGAKSSLKSNVGDYSIELTGNMSGKIFVGSANADTIQIAANNALVDGGKGNDQFDISDANVTILSSAGNDTANFANGFAVSLSGATTVKELAQIDDGVQLTFSNKATLTVTDVDDTFEVVGKKQTFTVDTSKFAVAKNLMFDKTSVTVAADFTGSIEQADDIYNGGKLSTVTTFDASEVAEGISIEGNAKANKIYGGAGDDTLIGGKGNDSLWGGEGSDKFIYGDGKDVIFGFGDDDLLEITGNFSATYNAKKDEIAFKVGSTANAITLREFTATEFHIGGTTYQISDSKLVKK